MIRSVKVSVLDHVSTGLGGPSFRARTVRTSSPHLFIAHDAALAWDMNLLDGVFLIAAFLKKLLLFIALVYGSFWPLKYLNFKFMARVLQQV